MFEAAGFELPEAERALNTVAAYVTGITLGEAAWHTWLTRHGQTRQEWMDTAMQIAKEATADYERLSALLASYAGKDPQTALDEDFDYRLDRILDGLQARLDAR